MEIKFKCRPRMRNLSHITTQRLHFRQRHRVSASASPANSSSGFRQFAFSPQWLPHRKLPVDRTVQTGQRVFDIFPNDEIKEGRFDVSGNGSNYKELAFTVMTNGSLNLTLVKVSGSENGPICNAYEILQVLPWRPETTKSDVILEVKNEMLKNNQEIEVWEGWAGDPCLPVPLDGITCESIDGYSIITELLIAFAHFIFNFPQFYEFQGSSSGIQRAFDHKSFLKGPVPSSITKLSHLKVLNLSQNDFTGNIPAFLPSSLLTSVDLSFNDLWGSLPLSLISLPHLDILNLRCNPHVAKDIPSSFNGSKLTTGQESCNAQEASNQRIIIGAAAASGFVLLTIVVGIIFCTWRQLSTSSMDDLVMKSISIETFTLEYIEAATQRYKTLIGEGGFGSVFRGTLIDGQEVAVKVRSATSTQGTREFENELNLLSAIRHENLVPLLGYCCENDQEILVYPFMSNSTLQDRLYGEAAKRKILDWPTRLSITLGAARGKFDASSQFCWSLHCIIHRDVKSSNILLDDSMTAKVADLGFSKYAPQEGDSCASLEIDEIVDPNIKGAYHAEAMWRVVEVALSCIEPFAASRQNMIEVVRELEFALIIENNASEYMRSIESSGSNHFSSMVMERRIPPPTPSEPSPILSQMAPPEPR
ncbi:hypothetical protein C1H46_000202 [Malus baccata]|uniref:Protein kinase domain-containing protein n=1 Tax=Malus baccata TaxID=106549 RepID=A0A540NUN0_MALBA|nr:hypothetical protein C1H46_000202 [Malus baccata]